uniref:Uncharacterized protein n=1 Tax=Anopheles arabiensis TaxID=7173 RepID=A0A182IH19_ANOAR
MPFRMDVCVRLESSTPLPKRRTSLAHNPTRPAGMMRGASVRLQVRDHLFRFECSVRSRPELLLLVLHTVLERCCDCHCFKICVQCVIVCLKIAQHVSAFPMTIL